MPSLWSHPPRAQPPLTTEPYDRWIVPNDRVKAEFHRLPDGYLLRFPNEADFKIQPAEFKVDGWPALRTSSAHFESLFHNAVLPLIGDHNGGVFLHGSAVAVGARAVAFVGQSGDGKTTLAGAFAKMGHPFLTEDVIELVSHDAGFLLQPKRSGLRLFADSVAYMLGENLDRAAASQKRDVAEAMSLPFRNQPTPLAAVFLLGSDHASPLKITRVPLKVATQKLLPHSFILDVEDKTRLQGHFGRIVELSCNIPCYTIDYRRIYAELPDVIGAIIAKLEEW